MRTVCRVFVACFALLTSGVSTSLAAVRPYPDDAAIRAIQFVDGKEGWAAGDDGIVLHSIDGGKTWDRQISGTRASLRGIHFITPYTGWIVGRVEIPTGGSSGVVLTTVDGGLHWTQLNNENVPGLNCVKFFNAYSGIACGDGSDLYPTGVFQTQNSGKTWKAVPGKRCAAWHSCDFSDAQTGAMTGSWGQLATLRDGYFAAADADPLGNRCIYGIRLNGSSAIAVGQGGVVLTSSKSAGMKWGFAELGLSREVLANVDFHAVATAGKQIWAVGRPGSFVLHSSDRGQTWEMQSTGQPLPLHAVYFANELEGWATGEFGTILATDDGGKTWKVRRQGAQRSAVLFIHARNANLPLETVALLGGELGYLTVGVRVTSTDLTLPKSKDASEATRLTNSLLATKANEASDPERLEAAMRAVGGAAGDSFWQFPLPNYQTESGANALIAHWDDLHGERSTGPLLRQLVLAIRLWQPELIVTDALPGSQSTAETIVVEAVKKAFVLAADEKAFPEQIATLKLSTWSAKKVCTMLSKADPTAIRLDATITGSRLNDSPKDVASEPFRTLSTDGSCPDHRWFRVLVARLPDAAGHSELMQGIHLAEGGQARRRLPPLTEFEVQAVREREIALKEQRLLLALTRGEGGDLVRPEQLLERLGTASKQMPPDIAARSAFVVANAYVKNGQWNLAREAFAQLVQKYPNDPVALEAYRWLVRYHTSSEARRRTELGQFAVFSLTEIEKANPKTQVGPVKESSDIIQTSHLAVIEQPGAAKQWYQSGLDLESKLAMHGQLYVKDPAMQLCFQAARRQLGDVETAKSWYTRYMLESAAPTNGQPLTKGADPWRDCVASEIWLANRVIGVNPPKPLGHCRQAKTRPRLDGKLDDACWEGAKPFPMPTLTGQPGEEYTAEAYFTYDHDYLYIGVRCTHPKGKQVPVVAKRRRDEDLRGHDRLSFLIDLDRDYQTYFQFQVDQRGCVFDDCWGDATWNPTWYAAVDANETEWTAEIAIPLLELSSEKPIPGKTWAVNVVRTIPGKGIQAWSAPADVTPRPEGMGLLYFVER